MSQATDQSYLLREQYQDASKLRARAGLHEQFSVNQYGWHRWVFDQFSLPAVARILEAGCGPGMLWHENQSRIPAGWALTLADLSPGMVEEAQRALPEIQGRCTFAVADIQDLPFADGTFDGVIADHMLYHVPDRQRAFAEVRRVLKPGGRFYAATNGLAHLREIHDLVHRVDPNVSLWEAVFSLESGGDELRQWFPQVALHRYEDALLVTEADPLVNYIQSMFSWPDRSEERLLALRSLVEEALVTHRAIHITKDSGLFVAIRDSGL